MKPERWEQFLEDIADEFELTDRVREVFKVRLAYENWLKKDDDLCKELEDNGQQGTWSLANYKKYMTSVYERFAQEGSSPLDPQDKKLGKLKRLREWLEKEKYPQWLNSPNPIESPHYIERPPTESEFYEVISKPGAFVRIKASKEMGKTLLIDRILTQLEQKGYQTIYYDLALEDSDIIDSYERFCQSLCVEIGQLLNLSDCLEPTFSSPIDEVQKKHKFRIGSIAQK